MSYCIYPGPAVSKETESKYKHITRDEFTRCLVPTASSNNEERYAVTRYAVQYTCEPLTTNVMPTDAYRVDMPEVHKDAKVSALYVYKGTSATTLRGFNGETAMGNAEWKEELKAQAFIFEKPIALQNFTMTASDVDMHLASVSYFIEGKKHNTVLQEGVEIVLKDTTERIMIEFAKSYRKSSVMLQLDGRVMEMPKDSGYFLTLATIDPHGMDESKMKQFLPESMRFKVLNMGQHTLRLFGVYHIDIDSISQIKYNVLLEDESGLFNHYIH